MSLAQLDAPADPSLAEPVADFEWPEEETTTRPLPTLPFAELVAVQAAWFRSKGTDFFDWLAIQVDDLADEARFLRAASPADFDARREVQERWARERVGY